MSGIPPAMGSFERAFRGRVAGCRRTCECGREFWDSYNSGYDWDEGEREALEANTNATGLGYAVELVELEGRYYVSDCSCWKQRAERVIAFIDAHADEIAEYLTLEKRRKQQLADRAPLVTS